jgi:uncharacterized membrane protein
MRMLRRRTAASLFGLLLISGSIAAAPAIPVVSWAGARMTVSGQISNKNDEPQKGQVVTYICRHSASDETIFGGGRSRVTGADGKFEIVNVPAGECTFSAFPAPETMTDSDRVGTCEFSQEACGGPTRITLTIRPGVNVHDLLLKSPAPAPPAVPVRVKLVDEAGQSLSGYAVIAQCGSSDCHAPGATCGSTRLKTDPDGASFHSSLTIGFCRLRACQPDASDECPDDWVGNQLGPCVAGEPCADVTVTEPGPVDVTLRRGAAALSATPAGTTVSGQVTNKNGEPQQGYVVGYSCKRSAEDATSIGGGLSTVTGADGRFEIVNVPAGECLFVAMPGLKRGGRFDPCAFDEDACGGPTQVTLTIRPGVNVRDLSLKSPLPIAPDVPVSVTVVDAAGQGLNGYAVIAQCGSSDCHAPGAACFSRWLWTKPGGAAGTFDDSLPAGFCRLRACQLDASNECPEDWVGRQEGPCLAGEPCADVTVTLPGPVDVTLRRGATQP